MREIIAPASGPWRYLQVGRTDPTDYSSTSYDDSGWATGSGPFQVTNPPGTHWDIDTRIWIRRWFTVDHLSTLRFHYYADNEAMVWVDGAHVADLSDPSGAGEETFDLTLAAGSHLVVVRGTDDPVFAVDNARVDLDILDMAGGFLVDAIGFGS